MTYYVPKVLLGSSVKVVKGQKYGYKTHILYLAPAKQNSKKINLCPHASKGCIKACLYNSGAARYTNIQKARINKTEYYIKDRLKFVEQLKKELTRINKAKSKYKQVVRLNGTTDIPWEKSINFALYPNIEFYDYTKNPKRMQKYLNGYYDQNYHLTFSKSESNWLQCLEVLSDGGNVSVVFDVTASKSLPLEYKGYKVIDGDKSDLRFLDERNVIVGLRYKVATGKGIKNSEIKKDNDFIVTV